MEAAMESRYGRRQRSSRMS